MRMRIIFTAGVCVTFNIKACQIQPFSRIVSRVSRPTPLRFLKRFTFFALPWSLQAPRGGCAGGGQGSSRGGTANVVSFPIGCAWVLHRWCVHCRSAEWTGHLLSRLYPLTPNLVSPRPTAKMGSTSWMLTLTASTSSSTGSGTVL